MNVARTAVAGPELRYCIEWRRWLWTRPVDWAIGDRRRFQGKRVLDLGCRYGKMSCYFASLGAFVHGVDVDPGYLERARSEAHSWGLTDRVEFSSYSGRLSELPLGQYDFVFSKSVLVVMGNLDEALQGIAALLRPEGEYIAVENADGGPLIGLLRRYWVHRGWHFSNGFSGLDRGAVARFSNNFEEVSCRTFSHVVLTVRARKPRPRVSRSAVTA
jgi:SAM-dependent methyltransferase